MLFIDFDSFIHKCIYIYICIFYFYLLYTLYIHNPLEATKVLRQISQDLASLNKIKRDQPNQRQDALARVGGACALQTTCFLK